MDEIKNLLLSAPPEYLLLGVFGILFVTCMGLLPNNSDITLLTLGYLASDATLPYFPTLLVAILGFLGGEGLMFSIGHLLGDRIHNYNFVQKVMPFERREMIVTNVMNRSFRFFLAVRLTPVLRPWFLLCLGSMNIPYRIYIRYHMLISLFYALILINVSFVVGKAIDKYLSDYKYFMLIALILTWLSLMRSVFKKR